MPRLPIRLMDLTYDHAITQNASRRVANDILLASMERTSEVGGMAHLMRFALNILGGAGHPVDRPVLEFGTYHGASALSLLAAIALNHPQRALITVDPYGSRPYQPPGPGGNDTTEFTDAIYRGAMEILAAKAMKYGLHWQHFKVSDTDYMNRVWPNITHWLVDRPVERPQFALMFFDAGHQPNEVLAEVNWAMEAALAPAGVVIIDDIASDQYRPAWDALKAKYPTLEAVDIGGAKPFAIMQKGPEPGGAKNAI